jgi:biopolymer transport protein ExbD
MIDKCSLATSLEVAMRRTIPFLAHADDAAPLMDINTTPLIDVLLVLLIMLLINLPLSTHAVKIDLPHVGEATVKRENVSVDIDFDGSIYWNDESVADLAQLESYFKAVAAKANQPDVLINANSRAQYDTVAKVLGAARRNGIRQLGFVGNERFVDR